MLVVVMIVDSLNYGMDVGEGIRSGQNTARLTDREAVCRRVRQHSYLAIKSRQYFQIHKGK
jgi:hypothetical protein